MIALVTGAAGFIGSHLCEYLLAHGDTVRGLDALTGDYARSSKERNLACLIERPGFQFVEDDLVEMSYQGILEDVAVVYHLAGQPGVTGSWGRAFDPYLRNNVLGTQRLLEACREVPRLKLVFASSSSVYGDASSYPVTERSLPRPISPYGVTKLAAEHLCRAYQSQFSLPVVALRLFTVYGPRQRPDMAFSRLVTCALTGDTFELRGNGEQVRDFTYVGDVVVAMRDAAHSAFVGVANVGGGSPASMNEVIDIIAELCGSISVERGHHAPGDVQRTEADTRVAAAGFGYVARTPLREGLEAMVADERSELMRA